ncbi:Hypothetical predicted protein [Olea europaea subsp. europaea]|uniref:Uncharacterized protein n=1 Tax=Olea europaea subsp. europaea TaxID=158383 RepID=A0A8S0S405_OLEEU|nr:Hypothetical predicted protein [Olea europaea subsp. europaea]
MSERKKLRDFLATLVAPAGLTPVAVATLIDTEAGVSSSLPQDGEDIAPCLDDEHHPMPPTTDEQLDGGVMEPSHTAPINDAEFEGCNVMDSDGDLIEAPVPATVAEPGHKFPTMRRRLRCLAPATRTPYTRGAKRTKN